MLNAMNDPTPAPTAPAGPTAPAATTPPGTALHIAQMVRAGQLDATQAGKLAKAGNISMLHVAQALHAMPAAPITTTPTVAPQVSLHTWDTFTPTDAAKMIAWEKENLAKGKITPEEAAKRFDALGATPEQRAPDTRSDDVKQLDAHFPPAKESDFVLHMYPPGHAPAVVPKEVQTFEANAKAWLGPDGAGLSLGIGNALISAIDKTAQATKGMSAGQLETYRQTELKKLQQAHGEKLGERLRAANDMIDELEQQRPGLKHVLGSVGVGKNAMVWNMLISHAPIYHARRKGR
jgi:hypothetical protein